MAIDNFNASKQSISSEEYVEVKKYLGVASVKVLALNPDNAKLRQCGWSIADDAKEPEYVIRENGKVTSSRLRFLVQIQDLEDKPIIALDFWMRPEPRFVGEGTKITVIDKHGRTAFATKEEFKAHAVPQYSNGPANISNSYNVCHVGEEEVVKFLMKLLNVTPLQLFNRVTNQWKAAENPGSLTIDDWNKLCNGDVSEIQGYCNLQPDNCVKVVLGIRTKDDNKTYQTFLTTYFLGNGAFTDKFTGEYAAAAKEIQKFNESHPNVASQYLFSAAPVKEWKIEATEVTDNAESAEDIFDNAQTINVNDLPF